MRLQILGSGTSTGVPIPGCRCKVCTSTNSYNQRTRTSAVIKVDNNTRILIDTSPDLRYQALKWDLRRIDAVLFTHAHADHVMGFDDLRAFNFINKMVIPCYGTKATLAQIRKCFAYAFEPDNYSTSFIPEVTLNEISDFRAFSIGDLEIQPFSLLHAATPVTGYRIGKVAYATDCKIIPDESKQLLRGLDYLILDGLRFEEHRGHFTIPEAIKMAEELGAKQTYLTHMTHAVDHEEVSATLPKNVALAYDGLEIEFEY